MKEKIKMLKLLLEVEQLPEDDDDEYGDRFVGYNKSGQRLYKFQCQKCGNYLDPITKEDYENTNKLCPDCQWEKKNKPDPDERAEIRYNYEHNK